MPAAVPIRSCSLIPMLKKRSGKRLAKARVQVEPERSASSTTTSRLRSPSRTRVRPYSSRVERIRAHVPLGRAARPALVSASAQLLVVGRLAVPLRPGSRRSETPLPLTVRATMAVGRSVQAAGLVQGLEDRLDVVAVDLQACSSRRRGTCRQRLHAHDLCHRAVDLQPVVVHDGAEVGASGSGPRSSPPPRSGPPAARRRRAWRRPSVAPGWSRRRQGHAVGDATAPGPVSRWRPRRPGSGASRGGPGGCCSAGAAGPDRAG